MMHHLDTHVILWLYDKLETKFSPKIKKLINQNDLAISPIIRLELQYLKEIKRAALVCFFSIETVYITQITNNRKLTMSYALQKSVFFL